MWGEKEKEEEKVLLNRDGELNTTAGGRHVGRTGTLTIIHEII